MNDLTINVPSHITTVKGAGDHLPNVVTDASLAHQFSTVLVGGDTESESAPIDEHHKSAGGSTADDTLVASIGVGRPDPGGHGKTGP